MNWSGKITNINANDSKKKGAVQYFHCFQLLIY